MKQLHQKIEYRKDQIESKKKHLEEDYNRIKRKVGSRKNLSLVTLGGVVIGFLLLPKKFKLLKSIFKAYTMAATMQQLVDLIPHTETSARKVKRSKLNKGNESI